MNTIADRNVGEGLHGFILVSVDQYGNAAGDTLKLKKAWVRGDKGIKNRSGRTQSSQLVFRAAITNSLTTLKGSLIVHEWPLARNNVLHTDLSICDGQNHTWSDVRIIDCGNSFEGGIVILGVGTAGVG